jgi:hypothetical protein
MPKFDPLAPVGRWDLEVELVGKTWTIPAAPASEWLVAVLGGQPESLLDLIAENTDLIEDALYDGELSWGDLETAHRDTIESASGVRWWEAQRLLGLALDWDGVGGELLIRGFSLEEKSLAQVCAAVWRLSTRGADEKDRNKIIFEIEKPPPGVDYEAVIDAEANLKAFGAIPSD